MTERRSHHRSAAGLAVLLLVTSCYESYPRERFDPELPPAVCEGDTFRAERVYPGVFILLDRSQSMDYPSYGLHYWEPAVAAIGSLVADLDDDVAFGLGLFPDEACDAAVPNCCAMASAAVPVELHSYDDIAAVLEGTGVDGGTPTAPSLASALPALAESIDRRSAYILLVTDGAPNCNYDLVWPGCVCTNPSGMCDDSTQCLDDAYSVEVLTELHEEHGVITHVVGLVGGLGSDWTHVMEAMAAAGGTGSATLVEDPEDIAPVLADLSSSVTPCLFDAPPSRLEAADVITFEVDGVDWPRDPTRTEGWDVVEEDRIRFFGTPCERILETDPVRLTGELPCY